MIQVISSVLVHYLDSQTPPVQAELVGQEDRVTPDTYRGGRERDNPLTMNALKCRALGDVHARFLQENGQPYIWPSTEGVIQIDLCNRAVSETPPQFF